MFAQAFLKNDPRHLQFFRQITFYPFCVYFSSTYAIFVLLVYRSKRHAKENDITGMRKTAFFPPFKNVSLGIAHPSPCLWNTEYVCYYDQMTKLFVALLSHTDILVTKRQPVWQFKDFWIDSLLTAWLEISREGFLDANNASLAKLVKRGVVQPNSWLYYLLPRGPMTTYLTTNPRPLPLITLDFLFLLLDC